MNDERNLSLVPLSNHTDSLLSGLNDEQIAALTEHLRKTDMYTQSKKIASAVVDFKEMMMTYNCAIKAVRTKFEILNVEYGRRYQRNPIHSVHARLKQMPSLLEKMERNGVPFSVAEIETNIHDIAGLRVVCSYLDDVYELADALIRQDDIKLIESKDYIESPKPNGYRSLHLIVSVPVYFAHQTKRVNVEVQIRTITMDFWASLEHQMKYKQDIPNQAGIMSDLKECADQMVQSDAQMLRIRKEIELTGGEPDEDDILWGQLLKSGITME